MLSLDIKHACLYKMLWVILKCCINAVSHIVRQLLSNMMITSGIDIDRDLQTVQGKEAALEAVLK